MPLIAQQMRWFVRATYLQKRIGMQFHDLNLLRRAFVHPSYGDRPEVITHDIGRSLSRTGTLAAQQRGSLHDTLRHRGLRKLIARMEAQPLSKDAVLTAGVEYHNQRLEFLGDAVVELITTHHIFCLMPDEEEGALTDYRTGIVNNRLLGAFAAHLGLHTFLLLAERMHNGTLWRDDPPAYEKVLADTFEALIGAIYLDRGVGPARDLFAMVAFPRRADLPLRRCWLQAVRVPYVEPDPLERDLESKEQAPLHDFERSTGLKFARFGLLRQAFTHPSHFMPRLNHGVPEPPKGSKLQPHNQRLEFMGDAVLQLASTDFLFHHFPEHQEGQLSVLRTSLVNNALICDVAATTGMHHCMRFFQEQMDAPGKARRGMLADCFEAFLGALYLDRQPLGMAFVKAFTNTMLFSLTQKTIEERRWMDPKMRLQHVLNEFGNHVGRPGAVTKRFAILDEWGPSHERMYLVGCYINGVLVAQARGQSMSDGQMGAALKAQQVLCFDGEDGGDEGGDNERARLLSLTGTRAGQHYLESTMPNMGVGAAVPMAEEGHLSSSVVGTGRAAHDTSMACWSAGPTVAGSAPPLLGPPAPFGHSLRATFAPPDAAYAQHGAGAAGMDLEPAEGDEASYYVLPSGRVFD